MKRLLLALLLAGTAHAAPGSSDYFLTHPGYAKHCESYLQEMSASTEWHVAFLWDTPGHDYSCLAKVLQHPKLASYEVILVNQVCQTNGNCGGYEFIKRLGRTGADTRRILKRGGPEVRALIASHFAGVKSVLNSLLNVRDAAAPRCYVNPILESTLDKPAARTVLEITRDTFPACKIVWNPRIGNPVKNVPGMDILEIHGSEEPVPKVPYIVNRDGEVPYKIPTAALFQKYRTAEAVFEWSLDNNCRTTGAFVDPRRRTECSLPKHHRVRGEAIKAALKAKPPSETASNLKGCKQKRKPRDGAKKGFLWKDADRHEGDQRPRQGTFLAPGEFKKQFKKVIIRFNGTNHRLKYRHPYTEDGSNRHIYDAPKPPEFYPNGSVIFADGICWVLDHPADRID